MREHSQNVGLDWDIFVLGPLCWEGPHNGAFTLHITHVPAWQVYYFLWMCTQPIVPAWQECYPLWMCRLIDSNKLKYQIFFPKFLSVNFLSAAFCIKLQMVEKPKVLKLTRLWSLISPSPLLHRESRWSDFVHPAPISSAHYVQFSELVVLK
jgi:hypothetical protein